MKTFRNLTSLEGAAMAVVSAVAAVAVVSAVLFAFADDSATPWFAADTQLAALLVRCEAMDAGTARRACLREVAAASAEALRGTTALARH